MIGSFLQIDQAAHPFWYAFFHTFNYTSLLYIVIYLLPMVPGIETIAEAKMMGITPLMFSFRGR